MAKKKHHRPAPQIAAPTRRFPVWWILPTLLIGGLAVGGLAIGWNHEDDAALRKSANTPPSGPSSAAVASGNNNGTQRTDHAPPTGPSSAATPAGDDAALSEADDTPPKMVSVPGGTFLMGRQDGPPDERPPHAVTVSPFQMDATEVTVGQFAHFVKATHYVTVAERTPDAKMYPGADPMLLKPGSAVFVPRNVSIKESGTWWRYVLGANWRHPEGPNSGVKGKKNFPAVQIAWEDAEAYAKWAGKRLPTEAEWEWAARGGLDRKPFCWGDSKQGEGGKWYANTYQGKFPAEDAGLDGFAGLAPVKSFPPNGYGLYDMSGNAWEWCSDWYDPDYYSVAPKDNPKGPSSGPLVEGEGQPQKVRRGGSFLCDDSYCKRYLPSARDKNPTDTSANHTGFRCVK